MLFYPGVRETFGIRIVALHNHSELEAEVLSPDGSIPSLLRQDQNERWEAPGRDGRREDSLFTCLTLLLPLNQQQQDHPHLFLSGVTFAQKQKREDHGMIPSEIIENVSQGIPDTPAPFCRGVSSGPVVHDSRMYHLIVADVMPDVT